MRKYLSTKTYHPLLAAWRIKTLILIFAIVTCRGISQAQSWSVVGTAGFSLSVATYEKIVVDPGGVPYVVFKDAGSSAKAQVKKYNGSIWVSVGTPYISPGEADYEDIALDASGKPYIVYQDWINGKKATVMRFDGSSWAPVGSVGFTPDIATNLSLKLDPTGVPYVAYTDLANASKVSVMKYNGSSWVNVGIPGFSPAAGTFISLAIDNSGTPFVGFKDAASSNRTTVMKFNGSAWVFAGSPGFSSGPAEYTSLAFNGSGTLYVGSNDNSGQIATVRKYYGTSWAPVGIVGFSGASGSYINFPSLALDPTGTPFYAYSEAIDGYRLSVKKFDGISWVPVGGLGISVGMSQYNSIAIGADGTPYVAFCDFAAGDKITVMKFAPPPITGIASICLSGTTTLGDAATGGVWSSSAPGIASVDAGGVVTGVTVGSALISYTTSGVTDTLRVTVYPPATAGSITGPSLVCPSASISLSDATPGGGWISSNDGIAMVSGAGTIVGVSGGTATISYVVSGCGTAAATKVVTVNAPNPGAITGILTVCPTTTTTLTSTGDVGGTWTSSDPSSATVIAATGVVTGVSIGTSILTYSVTNSCGSASATAIVTVTPLPNAGTITGSATVCEASTITLTDGAGGGTWSSSSPTTGTVNASGVVTGISGGTITISYSVTNSCATAVATKLVTVNPLPNAGTITGTATVCPSATTTLNSPTGDAGGAWASSTTAIATIGATTGIVTGVANGTSTISYTVANGCGTATTTKVVTVSPLPGAGTITGASTVCPTATITLSDGVGGGVWSSSVPARATVNATGVVTGVAAGTTTISYSVTNSCGTATATKIVTVNPAPNAGTITGTASMCPGFTTTLSDAAPGGAWSSTIPGVATINASGVVNGLVAGTTTISYTVINSCGTAAATVVATVNPFPAAISGLDNVCESATIVLTDPDAGGAWSSSNANATVGLSTGAVTGVLAGTVVITYMLPTSCLTTEVLTVNPQPLAYSMTGGGSYCAGGAGLNIGLAGSAVGINYQLYYGAIPTGGAIAGTGSAINFGLITPAGTYTVQATNTVTSCMGNMSGSATIIVNPYVVPSVGITHSYPGTSACNGTSATFTAVATNGGPTPGYQWYVNGVAVGSSTNSYSYIPANGDVVSVTLIPGGICVLPTTAAANYTVSVLPIGTPTISITSSPGNPICASTTLLCSSVTTFAGTAPTFLWLKNGINVATGATYRYIPSNGDVIICKMTSNYNCRTTDLANSNTLTMTVEPNIPGPVVNINAMPGTVISAGQTVTFSALATGGSPGKSYQWFINGTIVSGATSSTFVSSSLTNGSIVTCRVTNSDACGNSTDKSVTISVGGLGVADNVQAAKMIIYPNPNDGTFVVNVPSIKNGNANVIVLNALGQKVAEFAVVTNEDIEINVKASPGIYFISAITDDAVFSTRFELH